MLTWALGSSLNVDGADFVLIRQVLLGAVDMSLATPTPVGVFRTTVCCN